VASREVVAVDDLCECPECGTRVGLPLDRDGRQWLCPSCETAIVPCSACGETVRLEAVWDDGACPACETPRAALRRSGGESDMSESEIPPPDEPPCPKCGVQLFVGRSGSPVHPWRCYAGWCDVLRFHEDPDSRYAEVVHG
jgi:DNA-directed RNA polymerase subunit RPC12/RpoP